MQPESFEGKQPDHELIFRFVNGSSARFVSDDLVTFVFTRRIYLALVGFAAILSIIAPAWLRVELSPVAFAATMLIQVLMFPLAFVGIVLLLAALSRGGREARLFEPLVTFAATVIVSQADRIVGPLIDGTLAMTRVAMLIDLAVHYALWQAITLVFFVFVLPVQRAQRDAARAGTSAPNAKPMFRLGRLTLDPDSIRHVESDDHYLVIRTDTVDFRVLGRLSEVVPQLDAWGMSVHRSHWLAYGEFGPVSRLGRTFQMVTRSGRAVPVSREKWRGVRETAEKRGNAA